MGPHWGPMGPFKGPLGKKKCFGAVGPFLVFFGASKMMKFGLFGGAVIKSNADSGDSLGYRPFMDVVSKAEELGFESMSLVEHHFGGDGQISSSLSLLSHLTAITSKLRLGTAVTVLPWHNPILLAEQVATIDVLSVGRVDFGGGKEKKKNKKKHFC